MKFIGHIGLILFCALGVVCQAQQVQILLAQGNTYPATNRNLTITALALTPQGYIATYDKIYTNTDNTGSVWLSLFPGYWQCDVKPQWGSSGGTTFYFYVNTNAMQSAFSNLLTTLDNTFPGPDYAYPAAVSDARYLMGPITAGQLSSSLPVITNGESPVTLGTINGIAGGNVTIVGAGLTVGGGVSATAVSAGNFNGNGSGLTGVNAATAGVATNALAYVNPVQFGAAGNTVFSLSTGYVSGQDDSQAFQALAAYANTNGNPTIVDLMCRTYLLNTNILFTNLWAGVTMRNGVLVTTVTNLSPTIGIEGDGSAMSNVRMYGPEIGSQRGSGIQTNLGLLVTGSVPPYIQNFTMNNCYVQNFETNVIANHVVSARFLNSQIISAGHTCVELVSDESTFDSDVVGEFNNHYGINYGPANAPNLGTNGIAIDDDGGISLTVQHCNMNTLHVAVAANNVSFLNINDNNTENAYGLTNDGIYSFSNCLGGVIENCYANPVFNAPGSNMCLYVFNICRMNDFTFIDDLGGGYNAFIWETNSQRGTWPQVIGNYGGMNMAMGTASGNVIYSSRAGDDMFDTPSVNGSLTITNQGGELNVGQDMSGSIPCLFDYSGNLYGRAESSGAVEFYNGNGELMQMANGGYMTVYGSVVSPSISGLILATNSPVNGYALRYTNGNYYWAP